jgi:FkbM family methyltransferase
MTVDICEYRHGRLLYFPNDPYHGRFLKDYGEYSEGEVDFFRQIVRPGDFVIEAGSHIGVHTIPLARLCKGSLTVGGLVCAFEPQREVYRMLCGNLALNGTHNVMVFEAAVGAESGRCSRPEIDYDAAGVNFGGVAMMPPGHGYLDVPLVALDDMSDSFPALRLIKADVEGMEADVVLGARNLIRHYRPFLYLEDDREEKRERLHGIVRDLGYRMYRHQPAYVEADPFLVSVNLLCVPTEMECRVEGLEQIE